VQPVPTLNYAQSAPGIETGIPHLVVANTTQIINDTLNNNAMVRIAKAGSSTVLADLHSRVKTLELHAATRPAPLAFKES
jgi:hypothetical protein